MTVAMDLATKRIIYVNEGSTIESLPPLLKRFKRLDVKSKAFAMDMWSAYFSAMMEYFPDTPIIFDKFHIEKNLNETISKVRKAVFNDEIDLNKRKLIKGIRWLLLNNSQNLDEDKNEKEKLENVLNINKPLATAYYPKEYLKQMWLRNSLTDAKRFLGSWVAKAIASMVKLMVKFPRSLLSQMFSTGLITKFQRVHSKV